MAYYMSCDIDGMCSLKLKASDLKSAIDEGYERVNEAYHGPVELQDACGINDEGLNYREAMDAIRKVGARLVSESDVADGCDIWVK